MIISRNNNIYYNVVLIIVLINSTTVYAFNVTHLHQRFKNVYNAVKSLNSYENKDYDPIIDEQPAPVLIGGANPNSSEPIQTTTITSVIVTPDLEYLTINLNQNNGPQSFSILMNFQNDGTSSYQFINDKYALMTAMSGRCAIGEM